MHFGGGDPGSLSPVSTTRLQASFPLSWCFLRAVCAVNVLCVPGDLIKVIQSSPTSSAAVAAGVRARVVLARLARNVLTLKKLLN